MTENKQTQEGSNEKLYAGKFKTVEDLENGYKNSAAVFEENEKLRKQVDDLSNPPGDYLTPDDIQHDEGRVNDLKARAKEAGLTQEQYNKMLLGDKTRVESHNQNFETARKELGEEKINILQDYVAKNYPKELQENMMRTFIGNKEARDAAMKHRDQLLNNQVPGMNKIATGTYSITDEDVRKAYAAKEKNPGDMKARNHYLNLVATKAAQDKAS